jgi:hypothetical protein
MPFYLIFTFYMFIFFFFKKYIFIFTHKKYIKYIIYLKVKGSSCVPTFAQVSYKL